MNLARFPLLQGTIHQLEVTLRDRPSTGNSHPVIIISAGGGDCRLY